MWKKPRAPRLVGLLFMALALMAAGCTPGAPIPAASSPTASSIRALSGVVRADGSGTVFPITEAVAEEYESTHPYVSVHVGVSGTGVGFEKFTAGATDISNASRPIGNREIAAARKNGIEYLELKVAFDRPSVLANSPRPIFIYVNEKSLQRPEVLNFVTFYLAQAPELVAQVGHIPLPQSDYDNALATLEATTP